MVFFCMAISEALASAILVVDEGSEKERAP
jgi:hypothetical protein